MDMQGKNQTQEKTFKVTIHDRVYFMTQEELVEEFGEEVAEAIMMEEEQ